MDEDTRRRNRLVVDRMVAVSFLCDRLMRGEALDAEDARWLGRYVRGLLVPAFGVMMALHRLAPPGFTPRRRLEDALAAESLPPAMKGVAEEATEPNVAPPR